MRTSMFHHQSSYFTRVCELKGRVIKCDKKIINTKPAGTDTLHLNLSITFDYVQCTIRFTVFQARTGSSNVRFVTSNQVY